MAISKKTRGLEMIRLDRRAWLAASSGLVGMAAFPVAAEDPASKRYQFCAFIKFVQALPYDVLAERIAAMGFDGIEATVRDGGHVLPERVEEDLPRLVDALKKRRLDVTIMASSVNSVKHPLTEKVLRTAAGLGIKRYRLAYLRYDLSRSIPAQLQEHRAQLKDLAALNQELGISGVYQNHAGATTVGSAIWDLRDLLRGIPPEALSVAFDIRHATVEGGYNWPLNLELIKPHLGALYVKDFTWKPDSHEAVNVPLGEGRVDPKFFTMAQEFFRGPVSLHVEYLPRAGVDRNLEAIARDFKTLRQLLGVL
jgi:sugar phosphate isomerase/epimerase